ncbi:hypothetical protein HDU83_000764, partial [Entophlyctis luteolus]
MSPQRFPSSSSTAGGRADIAEETDDSDSGESTPAHMGNSMLSASSEPDGVVRKGIRRHSVTATDDGNNPAGGKSGEPEAGHHGGGHGGHDNPNWSTWKSAVVLLLATLCFSLIAEVLIDCVDNVIDTDGNGGDGKW